MIIVITQLLMVLSLGSVKTFSIRVRNNRPLLWTRVL